MNLEVQSGVPIPKRLHRGGWVSGTSKYPFAKMNVGDSFQIPKKNIAVTARQWKKAAGKHDWRFVVRQFEGSYRIWRIA